MIAPDMFALGGRQDDDAEILALFREWLAIGRRLDAFPPEDSDEYEELSDHHAGIENRIFQCRGTGAGLAVKLFLLCRDSAQTTCVSSCGGSIELTLSSGEEAREWWTSALRDAAVLVPEVGECAALSLHEDALLIAADVRIQWARWRLGSPDARVTPAFLNDTRWELERDLVLVAGTSAKTVRGEEIKARYMGDAA